MMRTSRSLDEQDDVGSGVGPADADVVEAAGVAQGEGAGFADDVGADPVVGVVVAGEGVELGLELGEGGGLGVLGGQPLLQCLLESFDFALGLGVVRFPVFLGDPAAA
jgi:hypothetical protein